MGMTMMGMIRCRKHGKVEGPFCQECRAEKYIAKVKSGKIKPKVHAEVGLTDSDILPLQIRFRAYLERAKRETNRLGKDVYPWQVRGRTPRIFSSSLFRRKPL
jgi:hypothetical protein